MNPRVFAFSLLLVTGCGSQPTFNVNSPIQIRSAALGNSYEQGGKPLDRGEMLDKLGERPASRADVSTAKTLSTVAAIVGAAGGALVGWPIGRAIGGDSNPPWVLAGIGAGLIVVSIPFSVVASNKVESAVEAHNRTFNPKPASEAKPE